MTSNLIQDTGKVRKDRDPGKPTMSNEAFMDLLEQSITDGEQLSKEINELRGEIHGTAKLPA